MKKFAIVKDDPYIYKAIDLEADNEIDALYEAINKTGYILIEEQEVKKETKPE